MLYFDVKAKCEVCSEVHMCVKMPVYDGDIKSVKIVLICSECLNNIPHESEVVNS